MARILVTGAGIAGLWQAFTLARAGHTVTLADAHPPFENAASRLGAAMLAPYCEAEGAPPIIFDLGIKSLSIWKDAYPDVQTRGSLVIAPPRDHAELIRFARLTTGHVKLGARDLSTLEPMLAERHAAALYYADEAHIEPAYALPWLLDAARAHGCETHFGGVTAHQSEHDFDWVVDCRGMGAAPELPGLRGVRGEMAIVASREIRLSRPVRLLHPRFPIYVVPWRDGRFMIGATVIESAERGAVSVRSALDLLSAAFAVHPAFAEAQIEGFYADVRPAFPDNVPRIIVRGRRIFVNGLYRHGFLLSPALAELVAAYVAGPGAGASQPDADVVDLIKSGESILGS
jgi:glycine oxidase